MPSHILMLDDDRAPLELLPLILEGEDSYQVTMSPTLLEDLAEVERFHPDLILLDCTFGGRERGWDYRQQLKRHRGTMEIPVILCTAAIQGLEPQETILRQKEIPILFKPFDIDELLNLVKQHLADTSSSTDQV